MKIYLYLSDRREVNETDVKYVETWFASPRKPNLASLDQTQSSQSGSNPVQLVGIKPSHASPDQSSLPSPDQTQSNQSRSTQPRQSKWNPV